MKDNFSEQSAEYARYRPAYPDGLYTFIRLHVKGFDQAWDCATGNGQIALKLAEDFRRVIATDISEKQLVQAKTHPSITYIVASAEDSGIAADSCDLITVGQAVHWFDFDRFYAEVKRVSKKGGLLVLAGYDLPVLPDKIKKVLLPFYHEVLGNYWDPERRYIDEQYRTLPFPFNELEVPSLSCDLQWNAQQLAGFVSTWSALQHYRKARKEDPLPAFKNDLASVVKADEFFSISFPILLKAAIVK